MYSQVEQRKEIKKMKNKFYPKSIQKPLSEKMADMTEVFRLFSQLSDEQRAYMLGVLTGIDLAHEEMERSKKSA